MCISNLRYCIVTIFYLFQLALLKLVALKTLNILVIHACVTFMNLESRISIKTEIRYFKI